MRASTMVIALGMVTAAFAAPQALSGVAGFDLDVVGNAAAGVCLGSPKQNGTRTECTGFLVGANTQEAFVCVGQGQEDATGHLTKCPGGPYVVQNMTTTRTCLATETQHGQGASATRRCSGPSYESSTAGLHFCMSGSVVDAQGRLVSCGGPYFVTAGTYARTCGGVETKEGSGSATVTRCSGALLQVGPAIGKFKVCTAGSREDASGRITACSGTMAQI